MSVTPADESDAVRLSTASVRFGRRSILTRVELRASRGSVYGLLGAPGSGKSTLVSCLLGLEKLREGTALVLGRDPWTERATLMRTVGFVPRTPHTPAGERISRINGITSRLRPDWDAESMRDRMARAGVDERSRLEDIPVVSRLITRLAFALVTSPELLVADDPEPDLPAVERSGPLKAAAAEVAGRGGTVFVSTGDAALLEGLADRVGILVDGRLVLEETLSSLAARYRRITYVNEATEERVFGTELDGFDAVRVKVRGWGIEAVVANFDEASFERFAGQEGVVDAAAAPLTLAEIAATLASPGRGNPDKDPPGSRRGARRAEGGPA